MNSRQKGKRGELEVARFLRDYGFEARRGQQYAGINGDADVVGFKNFHNEVKWRENLNVYDAIDQSRRDAKEGEIPIVWWKKNYHDILIIIRATDFMKVTEEYEP